MRRPRPQWHRRVQPVLKGLFGGTAGDPSTPIREPARGRSLLNTGLTVMSAAGLAMVAGALMTLAAARVTTIPAGFLTIGATASAAVWGLFTWQYGGQPGRPGRGPLTGIGALLTAGVLIAILLPVADPTVAASTPPGAGVWTLSDGTHLAYGVVRAQPPTADPVVVIHGGPGVPDLAGALNALQPLTADGHDVYAYAQVGSGGSSRLADPSEYTVDRAVADLDQVRLRIGADQLILIGDSYGAFLAAAYVATYPAHVAKVVFTSPSSLRNGLSGSSLQSGLSWQQRLHLYALVARPRLLLTYALLLVNPAAAYAFDNDDELDPRMDRLYAVTASALHCPGRTGPDLHGLGFYANQTPQSLDHPPVPDITARLRTVDVPALVLKGQCDYIDWKTAATYVQTIPGSKMAYLHGAGHDLKNDTPNVYLATVRAFLANKPVPHLLTTPTVQPADYQPAR